MTPERWRQITDVFDAVLERQPKERPAYLADVCGGDEALRGEVESLLSAHQEAGSFIAESAMDCEIGSVNQAKGAEHQARANVNLTGQSLGHYQMLDKLGEGGMGVVYKARDTRLRRTVAIKVLPADRVSDADRKRRFMQEAQAASSLNHPNIITIYDIESESGIDFIAMEYVAGKTLAELIPRRGLKLDDVLKYGTQVASALAKAHSAGIIHRDLKPTNVMVTDEGLVKVLDFGLAKLTEVSESGEGDTRTLQSQTEEGTIIGTLSYMSPEQAEGKKVDARSDIFSFGSVLYEMVTGRRAFQGDSKASTIAAILKEEPKVASQIAETLPKELERAIGRCLRKDRERRWQTMGDLKVALQELKEESDSGVLGTAAPTLKTPRTMTILLLVSLAVVVLTGLGWFWFGRSHPPPSEPPMTAIPLTSYPGSESYPSFSPDGSQVAFSWNGEKQDNFDIYVKVIGTEPPLPLTTNPAKDYNPAWSPDGRWIAFCRDLPGEKVGVILISPLGGPERKLTETNSPDPYGFLGSLLTWSPDSRSLVIIDTDGGNSDSLFLYSVETREKHRLTSAPSWDWGPAVSPDGHTLAFSRWAGSSDLYLLDLSAEFKPRGEPKRLTSNASGPVWTPDGNEIVFFGQSGVNTGLWRMPISKPAKPQILPFASNQALRPAVSRQGKRLAYEVERYDSNIWRLDLLGPDRKPGSPVQFITSTQQERSPAYSPDGKRIAFVSDRSGNSEVWASDSDGTKLVKLTSLGKDGAPIWGPEWSPDNQSIAFFATIAGNPHIYVVDANGGAAKAMTTQAVSDHPCWSRDGKWLYFRSHRNGNEIWKMPSRGGEAIQVPRVDKGDVDIPHESPDGKWLYYSRGWPGPQSVWKMPVAGGESTRVLEAIAPMGKWTVGPDGIYFFTVPNEKGQTGLSVYEFATGKTRKIRTMERPAVGQIAVSPDGRTILYGQFDEVGRDLMLVENFH